MIIRHVKKGEEEALFCVFYSAIHQTAAKDYSALQLNAWAPLDIDKEQWAHVIQKNQPWVVELNGESVAYADLQPDGTIDHFFVSAAHSRQGIGSALMKQIINQAGYLGINTICSHVSKTAEPFFASHGFFIVKRKSVTLRGVSFDNVLMHKRL